MLDLSASTDGESCRKRSFWSYVLRLYLNPDVRVRGSSKRWARVGKMLSGCGGDCAAYGTTLSECFGVGSGFNVP